MPIERRFNPEVPVKEPDSDIESKLLGDPPPAEEEIEEPEDEEEIEDGEAGPLR